MSIDTSVNLPGDPRLLCSLTPNKDLAEWQAERGPVSVNRSFLKWSVILLYHIMAKVRLAWNFFDPNPIWSQIMTWLLLLLFRCVTHNIYIILGTPGYNVHKHRIENWWNDTLSAAPRSNVKRSSGCDFLHQLNQISSLKWFTKWYLNLVSWYSFKRCLITELWCLATAAKSDFSDINK